MEWGLWRTDQSLGAGMDERQQVMLGALIGASIGLLLVMLIASQGSASANPAAVIILPLLFAALGFGVVISYLGGQPYVLHEWVPLPPGEIQRHAIRWYAVRGWTMQGSEAGVLTFTRGMAPAAGDGGCLLLLAGLPGLLYLMLARPQQTTTILTTPAPGGTNLELFVNARSGGGQGAAVQFFNSLHDLALGESRRGVGLDVP